MHFVIVVQLWCPSPVHGLVCPISVIQVEPTVSLLFGYRPHVLAVVQRGIVRYMSDTSPTRTEKPAAAQSLMIVMMFSTCLLFVGVPLLALETSILLGCDQVSHSSLVTLRGTAVSPRPTAELLSRAAAGASVHAYVRFLYRRRASPGIGYSSFWGRVGWASVPTPARYVNGSHVVLLSEVRGKPTIRKVTQFQRWKG